MANYTPKSDPDPLRIKTAYVSAILTQTAEAIRDEQQRIVEAWSLFDTYELEKSLKGHFSVDNVEGGARLTMTYLVYARYLDMADKRRNQRREGYHLYNRTVFGIVYNRTLAAVKTGFTEEIQKSTTEILAEAVQADRNANELLAKRLRTGYF